MLPVSLGRVGCRGPGGQVTCARLQAERGPFVALGLAPPRFPSRSPERGFLGKVGVLTLSNLVGAQPLLIRILLWSRGLSPSTDHRLPARAWRPVAPPCCPQLASWGPGEAVDRQSLPQRSFRE